jgi:hypothetical protein
MNRFDYTEITRKAFNAAVALDIIDAVELGCMMNEHNGNVQSIMDDITAAAYTWIHTDKSKHSVWCGIYDAWFISKRAGNN